LAPSGEYDLTFREPAPSECRSKLAAVLVVVVVVVVVVFDVVVVRCKWPIELIVVGLLLYRPIITQLISPQNGCKKQNRNRT